VQPTAHKHTPLGGGCKYNAKLRTSRHINTFKLLQHLLGAHNGGRWPILSRDLGSTPVKDFKAQTKLETSTPQENHILQSLQATQECLQNDKDIIKHPTIIPENILPKYKRPKHHKRDIIKAIGYRRNSQGQLVKDTTYKGRRSLQLVEC
jgi:hypothetical protein